ncbi:hypothetical protein [Listeria booriae]|uniref:LITAF domain-containing protein n=1 Tax=Listeria booriae TaxID=1552123 RepID=A0A841ZUU3_9LIST|nr:hypothetical protein [Listeria booriae]MBC1564140.1 hypothetical protein [Listeria booriae]
MVKKDVKGQAIVHCPNCGENKVMYTGNLALFAGAVVCTVFIITFPIALVLWIMLIVKSTKKERSRHFRCTACKHSFQVEYEKYIAYENAIK